MKVKYADQTAFCIVEEGLDPGDPIVSTSLEEFFPTLTADDAILIKKVTFGPIFGGAVLQNPA